MPPDLLPGRESPKTPPLAHHRASGQAQSAYILVFCSSLILILNSSRSSWAHASTESFFVAWAVGCLGPLGHKPNFHFQNIKPKLPFWRTVSPLGRATWLTSALEVSLTGPRASQLHQKLLALLLWRNRILHRERCIEVDQPMRVAPKLPDSRIAAG